MKELPIPLKVLQDTLKMRVTQFESEPESQDYDAHKFLLGHYQVVYRASKITPTKTGQFVTLWQRSSQGPIVPFEVNDSLNLVVIFSEREDKSGLFVFTKDVLVRRGIVSAEGKKGKLGFRIYPPWASIQSANAQKSQNWQVPHFFNMRTQGLEHAEKLEYLLKMES